MSAQDAKKIILDCDPGVDDAIAIMLACAAPQLEVLGVTCVMGNKGIEMTYPNGVALCQLSGRPDLPVLEGCSRPIMARKGPASVSHGSNGLGGIDIPMPALPSERQHAVDFIIEQVNRYPGEVILCPVGPLTNIAVAILKDPSIVEKVHSVVFMGGAAFRPGNTTPTSEFNVYADPHAAQIVMDSGMPLVMFGLDVTQHATITEAFIAQLEQSQSNACQTAARMLRSYGEIDLCLHDPCVVAYVMQPDLFSGVDAHVTTVTNPGASFGQTVARATPPHLRDDKPNCLVMTGVDVDRFIPLLAEHMLQLP